MNKRHFLRFLSQARLQQDIMPTIFERDGKDIIAIRGFIVKTDKENIEVCTDIASGGYSFE